MILIALVAVLAVAALAMGTSAQTNPPASGDWVITDSTTFTNQQITINNGDILINGNGHLSLTNVNLRFTGTASHQIRVSTNARLTISGGTITSSGGTYQVIINGGLSSIDGCTLTQSSGILINTWKAKVTNNTIDRSSANGISFTPGDSYSRPVDISDNMVMNSTSYGIYIIVGDYGNSDIKIVCVGNNVSGSLRDGIHAEGNTDKGRFLFQSNELYRNAIDGLYANLQIRVVEFRIDDIRAHNNTDYGVYVRTYASTMLAKYIYNVTSIGNGGEGVYISFDNQHWDRPVFRNWHVRDNGGGGIQFRNFNCATLEDSYCVNERSQADYSTVNTNLEIYRTEHRKGNARVSGGAYMITSFRYLNFHATWQNGIPCRYNTVQFEDNAGNILFTYTSNYEGWLGNHTEWDWRVRETRTTLRHSVTPYLVGGTQRLTGSSFDFDRDFKEALLFHDIQTPDLAVDEPGTNHVQNFDNLTIAGSCLDAHSGARVVQISFDPNPSWHLKHWENASGTSDWEYYLDPAPDDVITIYVRAFDWANFPNGMFANITISNVTIDTTAPNLTIIQPLTDIITNQSQLTVLGTTDPDVVTLTINGEYLPAYGGTFNKAIQLNEGINNIVIIATDYAGNIANATRKIVLDSIPPIVVVRHPINELYTNEIEVTIGGVTDREGVTMTIAGDPVPVQADGTWSHTVTLLRGWNFILIDAVDIALNHRVVTHKVYYDPDPPRINVFKPEPNDDGPRCDQRPDPRQRHMDRPYQLGLQHRFYAPGRGRDGTGVLRQGLGRERADHLRAHSHRHDGTGHRHPPAHRRGDRQREGHQRDGPHRGRRHRLRQRPLRRPDRRLLQRAGQPGRGRQQRQHPGHRRGGEHPRHPQAGGPGHLPAGYIHRRPGGRDHEDRRQLRYHHGQHRAHSDPGRRLRAGGRR
jgi:hypothetical protein